MKRGDREDEVNRREDHDRHHGHCDDGDENDNNKQHGSSDEQDRRGHSARNTVSRTIGSSDIRTSSTQRRKRRRTDTKEDFMEAITTVVSRTAEPDLNYSVACAVDTEDLSTACLEHHLRRTNVLPVSVTARIRAIDEVPTAVLDPCRRLFASEQEDEAYERDHDGSDSEQDTAQWLHALHRQLLQTKGARWGIDFARDPPERVYDVTNSSTQ